MNGYAVAYHSLVPMEGTVCCLAVIWSEKIAGATFLVDRNPSTQAAKDRQTS